MKRINIITGCFFLFISALSLHLNLKLAAASLGALALGLLLSDVAYLPARAAHPLRSSNLPAWRRRLACFFIALALVLFAHQIVLDFTEAPQV